MHYIKQDDFEHFKCLAAACPMTCCKGWQIVIDDISLEKYQKLTALSDESSFNSNEDSSLSDKKCSKTEKNRAAFCKRLSDSIDFSESCYYQKDDGSCIMLGKDLLCDQQLTLGEDSLCDTCRLYPRHTEEFEDVRELSLSISCPQAARMLLERDTHLAFVEYDTDETDDFEDYKDYNFFLYSKLVDLRDFFYAVIKNKSLDFDAKCTLILQLSKECQICIDEERVCDIDQLLENYRKDLETKNGLHNNAVMLTDFVVKNSTNEDCVDKEDYVDEEASALLSFDKSFYKELYKLEVMNEGWKKILKAGEESNYTKPVGALKMQAENLLLSFIYVYFCGGVYDYRIFSKAAFCVYSVRLLLTLQNALKSLDFEENTHILTELTYKYTRETEHSDINLLHLEDFIEKELLDNDLS